MTYFFAVVDAVLWLGGPLIAFARDWRSRHKTASVEHSPLPLTPLALADPHRRPHNSLTLAGLLDLANRHYPDGWLTEYFDPSTGQGISGSGDTLAQFIVVEISETFVPDAPRSEQLEEARRVLLRAVDDLHGVIQGFDACEQ